VRTRVLYPVPVLAMFLLCAGCMGEEPATRYDTTYQALEDSPKLFIVSPANNVYLLQQQPATPVPVSFQISDWPPYPAPDKEVHFFVDGLFVGSVSSGNSYTVPDMPFGVHTLTGVLYSSGEPIALASARSSRTVRITTQDCAKDTDCEEGNPCSLEGCLLVAPGTWECHWGLIANCCYSLFDCPFGTTYCTDLDNDGLPECIECLDDFECEDENPCSTDHCVDGFCLNLPSVDSCATDTNCDDGNICTEDSCNIGECQCIHNPVSDCCNLDSECDDGDPCSLDHCLVHECRHGPKYFGQTCCTEHSDCKPSNPCKKGMCSKEEGEAGSCVFPDDLDKPDCCLTDNECPDESTKYLGDCYFNPAIGYNVCAYSLNPEWCELVKPSIRINEAMINPVVVLDSLGEWVELVNASTVPVDLSGYRLRGQSGAECILFPTKPHIMAPASYAVISRITDPALNGGVDVDFACGLSLSLENTSDKLMVITPDDAIADVLKYSFTGSTSSGASRARTNPHATGALPGHWQASTATYGPGDNFGTPGTANTDLGPLEISPVCDDELPCTLDICNAESEKTCSHLPMDSCCLSSAGCDDKNICTSDQCGAAGTCVNTAADNCCNENSECLDEEPCTVDVCINHSCRHGPLFFGQTCCILDEDCLLGDPCVSAACLDGLCVYSELPDCCTWQWDCYDGKPCTTDSCNTANHKCEFTAKPGCCQSQAECEAAKPPEFYCRPAFCLIKQCKYGPPAQGCCALPSDCDDGHPCTLDMCNPESHSCVHETVSPSCCDTADDCPPSIDPCQITSCQNGTCTATSLPACCIADVDCLDDSDCTTDVCLGNTCHHVQFDEQNCCQQSSDCAGDGLPCTLELCTADVCTSSISSPCFLKLDYQAPLHLAPSPGAAGLLSFHPDGNDDLSPDWVITTSGPLGPDLHLQAPLSAGETSCLATPFLKPSEPATDITLAFDMAINPGTGTVVLEVRSQTWPETDNWTLEWTRSLLESTTAHHNVTMTSLKPDKSYRRYAICFKSFGATGDAELDQVVVAAGQPPLFLSGLATIPAVPGEATYRSIRAYDPDSAPYQDSIYFALGPGPDYLSLGEVKTFGALPVYQTTLRITPDASKTDATVLLEVRAYTGLLYAALTATIYIQSNNCSSPADCNDGETCTLEACTDGLCKFTALTPCCSNAIVEAQEQCDDGNVIPQDGCSPGCTLEDNDWDGWFDYDDNCPYEGNPSQTDLDEDGIGDKCDPDKDGDNVVNLIDNCPKIPNGGQYDTDSDTWGNACDDDDDGDTVDDSADNCPLDSNSSQVDSDGDGDGDACDSNDDNDEYPDAQDNCPILENPDQIDTDGDGIGDLCDPDIDGDGYEAPFDCDDLMADVYPRWILVNGNTTGYWRWHARAVVGNDGLLCGASEEGSTAYDALHIKSTVSAYTTGGEGLVPLDASDELSVWYIPGTTDKINIRLKYGFLELPTSEFNPDSLVVDGKAIAWMAGTGANAEIYLWKDGHSFQLSSNQIADLAPAMDGSRLVWQRQGEIIFHNGSYPIHVTDDNVLDELPVINGDYAAWIRHSGPGGAGNIEYLSLVDGSEFALTMAPADHSLLAMGPYGVAWRQTVAGQHELALFNDGTVIKPGGSAVDNIFACKVGNHFVAWIEESDGIRSLRAWDGSVVTLLDTHLPPGIELDARGDDLAWSGGTGPRLGRWMCTSQSDLDGDGFPPPALGGQDCDDLDSESFPVAREINLTMGALSALSDPVLHAGKIVWAGHDGNDFEIFSFDGKIILQLTDNSIPDHSPTVHDGTFVWLADNPDETVVMRYDGSTLGPVPDSAGAQAPAIWGADIAWLVSAGKNTVLRVHNLLTQTTITFDEHYLFGTEFSLQGGRLAWTEKGTDLDVAVADLETGAVSFYGIPVAKDTSPRLYGERLLWRTKASSWDIMQADATGTQSNLTEDSVDDSSGLLWYQASAWISGTGNESEVFWNHADGKVEQLTDDNLAASQLTMNNGQGAWISGSGDNSELYFYDGETVQVLTDDEVADSAPDLHRGQLVWKHGVDLILRTTSCGTDFDEDGISNGNDNCPDLYNPNQTDLDSDEDGDICDPDDDADTIPDVTDNCPYIYNPSQSDYDGDDLGNSCDPDGDGDGHLSTTYGGDDCDDLDETSLPLWTPQVISGGVKGASAPVITAEAIVWQATLFGQKQIYYYADEILFQLTSSPYDDENPAISGGLVVWEHDDGNDKEIWYSFLDVPLPLTDNLRADNNPFTDGESVVWYGSDGSDYEIYHWDGEQILQLTNNVRNDYHPHVSGDLVVWRGFDGKDYEIYLRKGGLVYNISNNLTDDGVPFIDGQHIVWSQSDGEDHEIVLWHDEEIKQLTNNNVEDLDPVVEDGRALWRRFDGHDYEVVFFTGSVVVQLTNDNLEKGPPKFSSGRVVWSARNGPGEDWEIFTYKAGTIVTVTNNSIQDISPAVLGDTIVWKCDQSVCKAERKCE
jgi:hypothetical protein